MLRSDPQMDPQTASWHLDKRVNLAMIVALAMAIVTGIGNTITLSWYASAFATRTETRLESAERRMTLTEEISRKLAETQAQLSTQVAVLANVTQTLAAVTARLEERVSSQQQQGYRPSPGGR